MNRMLLKVINLIRGGAFNVMEQYFKLFERATEEYMA